MQEMIHNYTRSVRTTNNPLLQYIWKWLSWTYSARNDTYPSFRINLEVSSLSVGVPRLLEISWLSVSCRMGFPNRSRDSSLSRVMLLGSWVIWFLWADRMYSRDKHPAISKGCTGEDTSSSAGYPSAQDSTVQQQHQQQKWDSVVCLLVGCLMSQQHASLSQGRIYSDNCMCCHTETEVADQTLYLTQSQYADTRLTSPSADPITPGAPFSEVDVKCLHSLVALSDCNTVCKILCLSLFLVVGIP